MRINASVEQALWSFLYADKHRADWHEALETYLYLYQGADWQAEPLLGCSHPMRQGELQCCEVLMVYLHASKGLMIQHRTHFQPGAL